MRIAHLVTVVSVAISCSAPDQDKVIIDIDQGAVTPDDAGGEDVTDAGTEMQDAADAAAQPQCPPHEPLEDEFDRYECDPKCQDCREGYACIVGDNPTTGRTTTCHEAGAGMQGDFCSFDYSCASGFGCAYNGLISSCRRICFEDGPDGCPGEFRCDIDSGDSTGVCWSDVCYPMQPSTCPNGQDCYIVAERHECHEYDETANVGDSCIAHWDCAQRQRCVPTGAGAASECRIACVSEDDCPGSQRCRLLQRADTEGRYFPVGACL